MLPPATPPRTSAAAAPADASHAVVTGVAELRALVQQAHAAGVAVPFEAELERLRQPIAIAPLVVWLRAETQAPVTALLRHLGVEAEGSTAVAIGERAGLRDVLRDAFTWRSVRQPRPVVWYCTIGSVDAEAEAWLAYEAEFVLHEAETGPVAAGACVRRIEGEVETWLDPALYRELRSSARDAFMARKRLWQCQLFTNALEHLSAENLRRFKSRRLRDDLRGKQLEREGLQDPSRQVLDAARLELENQAQALQRTVLDAGKLTFGPDGTLVASLRSSIESLGPHDLLSTMAGDAERLRLHDRSYAHIRDSLKQQLRNALKQDWTALQAGRTGLEEQLARRLDAAVPLDIGDDTAWLQGFTPIALENTYAGDLPKSGFLRHLSHGKQAVFATMAVLTLVGMLFQTNWRQHYWVVLLLLPLFIGAAIYSSRSSREDTESRRQKELEKLREQLLRDVRRVITEMQRDRQARVQAVVENLKREALRQIDARGRATTQARSDQLQRARSDLRDRTRLTDGKLRDAAALASNVARARGNVAQLLSEAERALRTVDTGARVVQ
jgi:hypothetical protein